MKTIIVCTDFSPNANNAVQYAAAFAQATKARLLLFHFYSYPIPATDLSGIFPATFVGNLEQELENSLEEIKKGLVSSYHLEVACFVRSFELSIDLEKIFHDEQADLVIMGMQGQNAVVNALIGNVPSSTIRRGKLPLLVVPQGAAFHPIQKILFPCDDHNIANPKTVQALRDMALSFDAYIEVLTLFDLEKTPDLAPTGHVSEAKKNLEVLLAGTQHGYSYENEEAINKGILYEAARSGADIVAMIPHHHSFLSSLLNQSETQRVAATISRPLLVLGESVGLAAH